MNNARASSYEEFKDAVSRGYPQLSPQLQRIARFALEKPRDLALGTVASIAKAIEVQPSSMIRFANALGFDGFSQMQKVFQGHLIARTPPHRRRVDERRDRQSAKGANAGTLLQVLVGDSVAKLWRLEEDIKWKDMDKAASIVATSQQTYLLAQRRAFPVACYLAYALNQLKLHATLLDGVGGMLQESTRGVGAADALVVTSFQQDSTAVVEIARELHARGTRVIGITDSAMSALRSIADVCFVLGDDSIHTFRSLVGPLCLAQALALSAGHVRDETQRAHEPISVAKKQLPRGLPADA